MITRSRITSILKANHLDHTITGLPSFSLSELNLESDLDFPLPANLRLGHLAEVVVSGLIKLSTNYKVLYENVQLTKDNRTIGEIDFIIEDSNTSRLIHMELAYKFYLYDPEISSETIIDNWIGPNRNDSLKAKLEKVKNKQFPLLKNELAKSKFDKIELEEVSQVLCLLVSLFIPYEYKPSFSSSYKKAIKGYYLNIEKFISLNHTEKSYYLPSKKEWGMDPSENLNWSEFIEFEKNLRLRISAKQAPLCWQKWKDSYVSFFIVWW